MNQLGFVSLQSNIKLFNIHLQPAFNILHNITIYELIFTYTFNGQYLDVGKLVFLTQFLVETFHINLKTIIAS